LTVEEGYGILGVELNILIITGMREVKTQGRLIAGSTL
jgi:hypothetical protein